MKVLFFGAISGQALFEGLFAAWGKSGTTVRVVAEISEGEYRAPATLKRRIWMRIRVNLVYLVRVAWVMFDSSRTERVIIGTSTPFWLPAFVSLFSSRTDCVIQLIYDLYPDALVVAGKIRERSISAYAIGEVVRFTLKRCAVTVFPGWVVARHAMRCYGPCRRVAVIPVGTDVRFLSRKREAYMDKCVCNGGAVRIVYVGNLGYLHEVDTLDLAFRSGMPPGLELHFYASGHGYSELRKRSKKWPVETMQRIQWNCPLAKQAWKPVMHGAHVGLVLLRDGAERVAFPSKAFSAMASGQALLAIAPNSSDVGEMILKHKCGWLSEPGDTAAFIVNLQDIASDRRVLESKMRAAEDAAAEYDVGQLAHQWEGLIEECVSSTSGITL